MIVSRQRDWLEHHFLHANRKNRFPTLILLRLTKRSDKTRLPLPHDNRAKFRDRLTLRRPLLRVKKGGPEAADL